MHFADIYVDVVQFLFCGVCLHLRKKITEPLIETENKTKQIKTKQKKNKQTNKTKNKPKQTMQNNQKHVRKSNLSSKRGSKRKRTLV